jgi:N-acyl-D-aspartate/D-glutamate deacylase
MYLIKNATLYDGTGRDGYVTDVLIDGDRIAELAHGLNAPGAQVINAAELAAAPGFIDIHSHSEFSLLAEPAAPSKIMQGVTTEISGNCGMSAAPLFGECASHRQKDLDEYGIKDTWTDFGGFFELMDKARPAVNFATYCGHGNVRASVMGYSDREPAEEDYRRMEKLLAEAMEAGALGLSTGLIYPPGVYSETAELIRLARVAARHGGVYTSHMRSEGAKVLDAIAEAVRIGREAGLPVQISHLKTAGPSNWGKLQDVVHAVNAARSEGLDVTADRYPYVASSTDLDAILPSWTYEGGADEELRRISDPATRERIRNEVLESHPDPEYWRRVMIASVETAANKELEGRTLEYAAMERGLHPVDALFDILVEEKVRAQAIYFTMSEDNLRVFLRQDWIMVGSDSTARGLSGVTRQGKPHPRGFGSFPRVLGLYARDEKVITLAQAIRKMTSMPAEKLGLKGRGHIKAGDFADMVIFDPVSVRDRATYEDPYQFPMGIRHVFVNGEHAVKDGVQTAARAGRVLRK